jgi:hypothetical protein
MLNIQDLIAMEKVANLLKEFLPENPSKQDAIMLRMIPNYIHDLIVEIGEVKEELIAFEGHIEDLAETIEENR